MKVLKITVAVLLLLILSVVVLYMYGPESVKQKLDSAVVALNLQSLMKKISGKNFHKTSENELLTDNQTFYVWKDRDGVEHYADTLAQVPPEWRSKVQKLNSEEIEGNLELMTKEEEGAMLQKIEKVPPPEHLKALNHQIFIYTYQGNEELGETTKYFDTYHLPYKTLDVVANPEYASQLKIKMGLDINQKYQLALPVIEINGELIQRLILTKDKNGNPVTTGLDKDKLNKIFGLRSTFE